MAVVAAETLKIAEQARDLVEVDYEPLPGVFDPEAALDARRPAYMHEGGNLLAEWELDEGDVDAALTRAADVVVERPTARQFVDHAYLEPEAGVAWRDADGVIMIRVATQVIEHSRDVARILELPDNGCA